MRPPKTYLGRLGTWQKSFVMVASGTVGKPEAAPFMVFEEDEYQEAQKRQIQRAREAAEANPLARWYVRSAWMDHNKGARLLDLVCFDCGRSIGAVYETGQGLLLSDASIRRRDSSGRLIDVLLYSAPLSPAPADVPAPMTSCTEHGQIPLWADDLRREAAISRRRATCRLLRLQAKAGWERYALEQSRAQ